MGKQHFHVKTSFLDMVHFRNALHEREKRIKEASKGTLPSNYLTNMNAKTLHPMRQEALIDEIRSSGNAKIFVLRSFNERPLAYFRAGQTINVFFRIASTATTRCYSLTSSPEQSFHGIYEIAVQKDPKGFVAPFIFGQWKVGTKVVFSSPYGVFYHECLRDEKNIMGLAGGSGITPFLSMARAVQDGTEDFNLTILYGIPALKDALYRKELDELAKNCPRIKVIYVLSKERKAGYEQGPITVEIIRRHKGEGPTSYFACGPQSFYSFVESQLKTMGVDKKHFRKEILGAPKDVSVIKDFPSLSRDKRFKVRVHCKGETEEIEALAKEPLLIALERAGLQAPSLCRGGECGFCRSFLLHGEVFVPWRCDGRRKADEASCIIHPCVSYPLSNLEIEVSPSPFF